MTLFKYCFFLLSCLPFSLFAQAYTIHGTVYSKEDNAGMPGAAVILYHLPDSAKLGLSSQIDGQFSFTDVAEGNYALKIVYLGYKDKVTKINVANNLELGRIVMEQEAISLKETIIEGKLPPVVQKGDTTELNSAAYKTNPDASAEDLITKMPGIVVQNGKVQAQGEDVKQVLVDGKPYFGDDPSATLKNLPAEIIDRIQVFDKQSDQAAFTGVDDGNSSKTINIITKPNMRNGQFGRIYGGYGLDNQYYTGGNVNFFKNNRRISILAQSNNINQSNFSTEDLLGVVAASGSSGGRGGGPRGRGGYGQDNGASDFLVNQSGGISTTHAFGINYSDEWGKKLKVSSSYFFNTSENNALTDVFRQYFYPQDSNQLYTQNSRNTSTNTNHRFNMRLEYQMDSSNSFIFTPRFSVQQNNGSSNVFAQNRIGNSLLNNTQTIFSSRLSGYNASGSLLFRHKFEKAGRTFSLDLTGSNQASTGNSLLHSENNYFRGQAVSDTLDQRSDLDKNGYTFGSNAMYTEPVSKASSVQFSLASSYNASASDKLTYDKLLGGNEVSVLDTVLSSSFNNIYINHKAGTGYRFNSKRSNIRLGVDYQIAQLRNHQAFPTEQQVNRDFQNLLPNAMWRYNITPKKNIRLFYRTGTNAPSVDQLQEVVNNTNPLQLTSGNPHLVQQYDHRLFMRYSSSNSEKASSFFAMLGGSYSNNYIGNSAIIANEKVVVNENVVLLQGGQYTRPVNLDGYFNVRSFASMGLPLDSQKLNLNLNASLSFSHTPGLINEKLNYANTPTLSLGAVLSSNISKKLDFTLSSNSSLNYVQNTIRPELNSQYFNQNSRIRFNWIFWKGIVYNTELNHQLYAGLSQGYNQNYFLWNMSLGKKLFKNQLGEIKLSAFDLLNQNNSIQRNITETYIEDVQTNVLNRYFLLTFTYNFRNYKKI